MPNITQYHIQWNNGPTKWLTWKITFRLSAGADCVEPKYPFVHEKNITLQVTLILINVIWWIYTTFWNTVERSFIINPDQCHTHSMTFHLITLSLHEATCLPRPDKLLRDAPCLCFHLVISIIHTAWLFIYVHQLPRLPNMAGEPVQMRILLRQF